MRATFAATLVLLAAAPAAEAARGLRAFESCAQLQRFGTAHLRDRVPVAVGTQDVVSLAAPVPRTGGPVTQDMAQSAAGGAAEAARASETNVQEQGVDEPDVVKRAGGRLLVAADGRLLAVDPGAGAPRVLGSLALPGFEHQLLVRGDRALVLAHGDDGVLLTEIDIADPVAMVVRRSMTLAGRLVGARLTEGTARVVVTSAPRPQLANVLRRFVPATTLRSRISGRTFRRGVAACDDVRRPAEPGGADLLTVLTVDLDRGLLDVDRDAVLAAGQAVYASAGGLYVASTTPEGDRTLVHRFDAGPEAVTAYRSTGSVPGTLLNQFSLSEHAGVLRVASTDDRGQESFVTTLREDGPVLRRLGQVGGLGRGERIYAVRFLGDVGFVVTFRQVDPLYTIDLAQPASPRVLGELKIEGYSAYLHPVGDGLLLGVGVDATSQGRRTGAQVSLFDVSDLRNPRRLHARPLGDGTSTQAEFDHHAFLWWAPSKLAVLPVDGPSGSDGMWSTTARALRVDASVGIAEAGRIEHRDGDLAGTIVRSMVLDDRLLTFSGLGVASHRLADLAPGGFARFVGSP